MSWRPTGGTRRAPALAAAVAPPPLGAAALSGRVRGRCLPGRPLAARGPGGGGGEGGGGGVGVPRSPSPGPLAPPLGGRGGAAWWVRSRGASRRIGGRTLPPPPSIFCVPDPRAGSRLGPPLASLPPRGAGGPGWEGGGGGRRFASAVSG